MQVMIKKLGRGVAVRIPKAVMAAASLSIDQAVDVREENGRIIIEPVRAPIYTLDELLADMRPETFPDGGNFGPAVGQEI